MQHSHQSTPPLTPISPTPFIWRHTRKPITPPVSSTLSSFSFGNSSPGGVRTRPHSQLHGPFHHPAHRHHPPPTPQKILHTLSRSSSALSLLSLSANNRNAVYIDEIIDIDSGAEGGESLRSVDLGVVKSGEDDKLQVRNEEGGYHTPLISPPTNNTPNTAGVNFNALRSSQVYHGIGTKTKAPTRPPPAPPLIIDDKGDLGGVGVIDEDSIEERDHHQFLAGDHSASGSIYSHHHHHHHHQGEDPFMSRWSLTSSIDEIPTPAGSGVVAFSVGGIGGGSGGLFGSRKRMSFGGDKIDKAKGADDWKEKDDEEKEKEVSKFTEKLGPIENEKEKEKSRDKKRGRLVSFISRISSNMIAPPPPATFQNIPFQNVTRLSSF